MNQASPIQPQQAQNMQQNASTQPQNPQQFSLNLFDSQQLAVQQQQQQLNTVNHISIPTPLQPPMTSPSNSDHPHYNNTIPAFAQNIYAPPHSSNNANLRNNNNNIPTNNDPPQAAVLQDFAAKSGRKNAYSPPDNIVNSPNSSSNGNNKHPNFDYKGLSRRLREQYQKKMLVWNEKSNQNERIFEQLDRPLVEALLLPKHRPQILQYEQRIIDFLMSDDWSYRFPANLSSFNRLLLHRLSETFKLDHHVEYVGNDRSQMKDHRGLRDDQNKAVTIYKMEKTRFANIRLSQIDISKLTAYHVKRLTDIEREEWEEKKSKYSMNYSQHHLLNNNHMNMNMNNNLHINNHNHNQMRSNFRYQKKLKPHDKNANPQDNNDESQDTEPQFDENEGQQQPVRMLLKKDNYKNNGRMDRDNGRDREIVYDNNGHGKKLKLENKQEKYNKMKEKIFSAVSAPKNENKKEQCEEDKEDDIDGDNEDEEVKQSLVGVIAEHEPYKEGVDGQEGQPDVVNNRAPVVNVIDNKDKNIPPPEVKCDLKSNDDTNEQKEGHSTDNASIPISEELKKKFGLKKGGWAIAKEKRTKDINHTELFKKSKERLHALCSGPKKSAHKTLRASILQKTLEEKRRSSKTYTFFPERYADGIDGAHTQKPSKNFNTHSLIPNSNESKKNVVVVSNAATVLHPTPPIVTQLTDATFSGVNSGVSPSKTSDFNQHDRGATPLLNTVADSQRKRNNPSHNFFKPGKTTEQIEKLLQPQPAPVTNTNVYNNGEIPASQLMSNYNLSRTNTQLLQQLNGGNVGGGVTSGQNNATANTVTNYTQPLQQATIAHNPYSLNNINTQQQNINQQTQFYNTQGVQGTVMQQQYGTLGVNNTVVNGNLQATQINSQPANLYDFYLRTHGTGVQQVVQNNNIGNVVTANGTVVNNNAAVVQQLNEHNITQQQLIAQKTQCLNAIQQYNQLIHYFQNAGALNSEQQTYLLSLQQNAAMQQQHLQKIQCAEILLIQQNHAQQLQHDAAQQQAEKDKAALQAQIDHHKNLQLQLASAQQMAQNQAAQIAQSLQLHTSLYNQAQLSGNQNAMYVATLQMQQDQQLQQQTNNKLAAIVQQMIQVGHIINALQQQKNLNAHQTAQTPNGPVQTQTQTQGQTGGNIIQQNQVVQGNNMARMANTSVTQGNDGNNGVVNYSFGNQQQHTYQQNAVQQPHNEVAQNPAQQGIVQQQQQRAQIPNPTVNALILHTGNSAGNVNINIYADGQSGQNQQNQNMQQDGPVPVPGPGGNGRGSDFNSRKNKSNRNRQFLAQMPNLYKNKTPGSSQDTSPTNSSENQAVPDGNGGVNEQTPLSLTNASSNSSTSTASNSNTPSHELTDMVHDIAMGPRHNRQINRPSPATSNKFNREEADAPANQNNLVATNQNQNQSQNKGSNVKQNQKQTQQNQHAQNNAAQNNPANTRTSFQSHHANQTQSNRGNNSQNNMQNPRNNQNNVAFNRNNNQSAQNNRGNNNNNQNNSFNNNSRRTHNRSSSSSWTPDVTVWMADWFYNRDQDTKNTILQLQKRLRLSNKKIKSIPGRNPPNPPDVFSNDNRNNANRYRSNSSGRRGRNYHQQRGRNNYVNNSRGYNSRRDNYGNNNRFNSNNNQNNNSNSSSNGSDNQNQNQNNRNNASGNQNNSGNRSGYSRNHRRNYSRSHRNSGHMRHNSGNNSASNNNQNNSARNGGSNSNQGHQQSQAMLLTQQNIQQIQNSNRNNNNLHRLQSQQIQQRSQNNVSFANNILNNNANNTVTTQTQ